MSIIVAFDLGSREAGCVVLVDGVVERTYQWKWQKPEWAIKKDQELFHRLNGFRIWTNECFGFLDRKAELTVAVEEPYMGQPRAALVLGQVLGMLRDVLLDHWDSHWAMMPILVQSSEAAVALTGQGQHPKGERKAAMMAAARMQFPCHEWNEHTADALGVALAAAAKLKLDAAEAQAQAEPNTGAPQSL